MLLLLISLGYDIAI